MANKQKKNLETSFTSKLTSKKDESSTQFDAKHPEQSKTHESSYQKSRPEVPGKKISIKPIIKTTSFQSHSVRPDSKQAQRSKKSVADSALDANEWMM
ncbi:stress response protein NST1-like [Cucumis melo var. makuwa]|uniref:Stress response protein NST1-like n=1 Tax=Cucumis melo var. makuwa TaxID=1194695 RepID=A0A5A7TAU0_CUCMM|nr:stress response protein NST1-like [Cucumis melo var. makuwa]TYK05595.1 stress response protein NST1-like [Cucumis melo var. makuwa]